MMSHYASRVLTWSWLAALGLAAIVLVLPWPAYANGRVLELKKLEAGPYELNVGTIPNSPVLGSLHMTMNVTDAATDTFIFDADISVSAVGPADDSGVPAELGPIVAVNSPTDPVFYDITATVDREGTWLFTFNVNGELGEGSADLAVEVSRPNPITGIVTLVTLLVFVIILGFSIRAYFQSRSRNRKTGRTV